MPSALRDETLKQAIKENLAGSPVGMGFYVLRMRIGFATRLSQVAMAMADLSDENAVSINHGTLWCLKQFSASDKTLSKSVNTPSCSSSSGPTLVGNPAFIGPVWEPAFADKLWKMGLNIFQQYPAEGYFLDIALVSSDGCQRLDVEVDGRSTHCDRRGRRKVQDVIRDAKLVAAGWSVKRFWVSELMQDMDECAKQVKTLWNQMRGVD